jgi:hypothetical protein
MKTKDYEYEMVLLRDLDFGFSELKFTEGYDPENELNYDELIATQYLISSDQEIILISLDYKLRHPGSEEHFASVVLTAGFKLLNFKDKLDEEGKLIVDPIFAATLLGVVYSTLRGVWHEKFRDTSIDRYIIPVINPMNLDFNLVYQPPVSQDAEKATEEA